MIPREAYIQRDFLSLRPRPDFVDSFIARRGILRALTNVLPRLTGTLLDIGCGYMPYRSLVLAPPSRVHAYVGLDLVSGVYATRWPPDIQWDGRNLPLAACSVDCAMATEVLEHCAEPELLMRETGRVLKPGGLFFLTVPFLWPLHDVPYDEYRYTPFALERLLRHAGFADVRIEALGGWDASLAQMIGLWVRRRSMPPGARSILSLLAVPVVRCLLTFDRPPREFRENSMVTGLSCLAVRTGA